MKKLLFPLLAGLALFSAGRAQAQDKPVLNTAPPGTPPPPPPTRQAEPVPVPATPPPAAEPAPTPTTDSPSGLNFPQQPGQGSGKSSDKAYTKKFIYSNFGLGFSSTDDISQFNFSIAPALGFRLTDRFAIGPGLTYSYNRFSVPGRYSRTGNDVDVASNSIGLKAFAQFVVYNEFFLHAEYEVTNAELLVVDGLTSLPNGDKVRKTVTTPLAGIGYRETFSDKVAADIVLLYNFDNTLYSLYPNPVIRFSFLFNIGR